MSETIQTKRCYKCKQIKPLSEFSKDRRNKDSIRACCKSCQKAYQQSEKGRTAQRKGCAKYWRTPKGKIANHKASAKYRKTPNGKATMKRFYAHNPNYVKAISAVNYAIADGKLPRPDTLLCHYCQKPVQQYHHWHGYEKEHWLDVVPACKKCHREVHGKVA